MSISQNRPVNKITGLKNLLRRLFKNRQGELFLQRKIISSPTGFWCKLIPPHTLYEPGSKRETRIRGINYSFDISNQADHYIYFGLEEPGYRSIERDIEEASVIFDIGANIGTSSLFFANINPSATVYGFEPHPVTYQEALKNISLNSFTNIHLYNFGFGVQPGIFELKEVDPTNNGMNRILPGTANYKSTAVEIVTLDSFVAANNVHSIDLVKIDVEGYELNVLKGGEQALKKFKPVLFIELDDDNLRANNASAAAVLNLLGEYGYGRIVRATDLVDLRSDLNFTHCHFDIIAKK